LSYDGTVYFGFSGDTHAAPDLRRLEQFLKASYLELRDATRPRQKKSARPKEAAAKPRAASKAAPAPLRARATRSIPPRLKPAQAPQPVGEEAKALAELIA